MFLDNPVSQGAIVALWTILAQQQKTAINFGYVNILAGGIFAFLLPFIVIYGGLQSLELDIGNLIIVILFEYHRDIAESFQRCKESGIGAGVQVEQRCAVHERGPDAFCNL